MSAEIDVLSGDADSTPSSLQLGPPWSPAQPLDPRNHSPDSRNEGQRQDRQRAPEARAWASQGEYHFHVRAGETTLCFRSVDPDFGSACLDIVTPAREPAGLLGALPVFLDRMRLHGIEAVSLNGRRLAIRERA